MTEEELNALMADMDRRASEAFDADSKARAPKPAPDSARTPSMIIRDTMRAQTDDDAVPDFEADVAETTTHSGEAFAAENAYDGDDGADAEYATEGVSDEIEAADEKTDATSENDAENEPALAQGEKAGANEETSAVKDDGLGDADDAVTKAAPDRVDDVEADSPTERRISLRVEKPAKTEETAEPEGERRVSLRVEKPVKSRSISQRRADLAPDAVQAPEPDRKKPRVMIMGEFSAGKSTLMNLLLGEPALPTNTTATQLPPVWISKGDQDQPMRVDVDGFEEPVDLSSANIPISDTHYIRLQKQADLLDLCDLIDTPGISDPNMPAEVWQRMVQHADVVIWCTHATQAWRQSEAAAWSMMPRKLQERSLLLLTRFDKVPSDRDRIRVLKRVRSETDEVFRDIFPISLTDAIEAGEDKDAFAAAGGESFADALFEVIGLVERKGTSARSRPRSQIAPFKLEPEPEPARVITPRRVRPRPLAARPLGQRSDGMQDTH